MPIKKQDVYGDMRLTATGVHAAGTTTFNLDFPAFPTHAANLAAGTFAPLTKVNSKQYTCPGNLEGDCVLYSNVDAWFVLGTLYPRDDRGVVMLEPGFTVQRVTFHMELASWALVQVNAINGFHQQRLYEHNPAVGTATGAKVMIADCDLDSDNLEIEVGSLDCRKLHVHGYEVRGFVNERGR